jgi:PTS system mannose-specific IIA component
MVGIVLVAHCNLADEFLQTLKLIGGEIDNICPVRFNPDDSAEASLKKIAEAVRKVDRGAGVLILTDMFGGTPSNLSLSLLEEGKVEVLTGVNLPMLIKLVNSRNKNITLIELAQDIKRCGQKNICVASELLKQETK